jgi:trk system potassium uptake protein TrkA
VHVVIVGCGRVGSGLAVQLTSQGEDVGVVDKDEAAFERLGEDFKGHTVHGVGFDVDVLEAAGVARADALVAVTGGDNSNVVAARIGRDVYRVPRVVARIHDPRRAEIYEGLGLTTVSSPGERAGGRRRAAGGRGHPPRRRVRAHPGDETGGGRRRPGRDRRARPHPPGRRARREHAGVKVMIAGAGVWGSFIAEHLLGQGHEVVVVEQTLRAVAKLRERTGRRLRGSDAERGRSIGGATVIHGDACEPSVLDGVGLNDVDTVVAATGDDEDNLVISLLCKRCYGVPRVVARVNNPKNTWLFTGDWGVDSAVSAPAVLTHLLDTAVGVQDVVALLRAGRRGVALVEVTLDEDAPALGRRPASLDLPPGAAVRGDQVHPGAADLPLEPGDEILAVTELAAEPALRATLGGQPGGSHTSPT